MHITLRPASPDDLDILQHWDNQPHVIDSDPNDDWNWAEELQRNPPWREQFIACLHDRPIGFVQIIDPAEEETHYWGDVEPHLRAIDIMHLSHGYNKIMILTSGILQDESVSPIRCSVRYPPITFASSWLPFSPDICCNGIDPFPVPCHGMVVHGMRTTSGSRRS